MYEAVIDFAYGLAENARIFTLKQVAKHPLLTWRSQPAKRASEILRKVKDDFERIEGPYGEPHRFRLSKPAKRRLGLKYRDVPILSQNIRHWLAIGDVYTSLRLNGGVEAWQLEPENSAAFDIFLRFGGRAFLLEVQTSPISSRNWQAKWKQRFDFLDDPVKLKIAPWQPIRNIVRPKAVIVDMTGQMESTVGVPVGVLVCKSPDDLPSVLKRYVEKTKDKQA